MAQTKKKNGEVKKPLSGLPPSSNKDFWGDAEISLIKEEDLITYQPKEGHEWRQQGPFLICNSCPLQHATYIGMNKQLQGFENGKPIIKRLNIDRRK